ncbi:hypothetical protein [Skermanella stibiiresistens]|uniref:hypothetical protein n=1 Tax=Skermanella stibiiresistens TaxID=913326 RepID=UPI0012F896E3|nr:hypothetical protein [Skermanella stibiiresistens]
MQKIRNATSIAGVIHRLLVELAGSEDIGPGVAIVAEACARSVSTVRGWADEDRRDQPTIEACLAMDRLYHDRTGLEPPIGRYYAEQVSRMTGNCFGAVRYDIDRESLRLHHAASDLTREIAAAQCPHSPGGAMITLTEAAGISQRNAVVDETQIRLAKAVEQAGPGRSAP